MLDDVRNASGERLDCTFHEGTPDRRDVVVIGHGVTGNKDRPWALALAETLSDAGIACVRFSFSGNGASEGRFEESTITKEVEDLGAVLDAIGAQGDWRVAYAGHSMGGAVGVLRAGRDERVRWLISLAGMVEVWDFAQRKFGEQKPGESCMWDQPACPLSQPYMDGMRAIHSVADHVTDVRVPWLLVHGTADTVVPIEDSRLVVDLSAGAAELVELEGADHVFSDEATGQMASAVRDWLLHQTGDRS